MADRYPLRLPLPKRDGYAFSQQDNKQITQMTSGYRRQRRRFAAPPPTYALKFRYTSEQLSLFRGWWLYGTNDGQDYLQLPMLVPEKGEDAYLASGRFIGRYGAAENVELGLWDVTANFELAEDSVITLEEYLEIAFDGTIEDYLAELRSVLWSWPQIKNENGVFG